MRLWLADLRSERQGNLSKLSWSKIVAHALVVNRNHLHPTSVLTPIKKTDTFTNVLSDELVADNVSH